MDTRETPAAKAAKAAVPQTAPKNIHALAMHKNFLTQEEITEWEDNPANPSYCQMQEQKLQHEDEEKVLIVNA